MSDEAYGRYRYFLTFTDDLSRYLYIYLMKYKACWSSWSLPCSSKNTSRKSASSDHGFQSLRRWLQSAHLLWPKNQARDETSLYTNSRLYILLFAGAVFDVLALRESPRLLWRLSLSLRWPCMWRRLWIERAVLPPWWCFWFQCWPSSSIIPCLRSLAFYR